MKRVKQKTVSGILFLALLVGGVAFQPTMGEAAKIKMGKNIEAKHQISQSDYTKNGSIARVDGKKYYDCFENKNATYYYSYPKPDKFTTGPQIKKNLFKGHIITIGQSQKRAVLGKGDKATYSLKVKKGVKILKMGTLYAPDELKVTATNKKITVECKKQSDEKYSYSFSFSVLFSYKGKKYYCEKTKDKIKYTIKADETQETESEEAEDSSENEY